MRNLDYVETFAAGAFVCDNCGQYSYFNLIGVENQLDQQELIDFYEKVHSEPPPEGMSGEWLMHPLEVKCQHCHKKYKTFQGLMEEGLPDEK